MRNRWDQLSELALGQRYAFELRDGRTVEGILRSVDVPAGYGGGNADGEHPIWVTSGLFERFLASNEVLAVRDLRCEPPFQESAGGS